MLSFRVFVAVQPRRLLDSFSIAASRPLWSYLHTGTLPRLISFVSHCYENNRGVYQLFPFWNSSLATYRPHSRSFFHALTNCPFCNSFVFKFIDLMGGYGVSHFFGVRTFRPADVSMCFRAIHFFSTLAHSSAHSCSSKKPQLFYFQSIAHSLQKNTRGWGEACDAMVD